jgi:hypothetical protein
MGLLAQIMATGAGLAGTWVDRSQGTEEWSPAPSGYNLHPIDDSATEGPLPCQVARGRLSLVALCSRSSVPGVPHSRYGTEHNLNCAYMPYRMYVRMRSA